jgi:hypothetical protein
MSGVDTVTCKIVTNQNTDKEVILVINDIKVVPCNGGKPSFTQRNKSGNMIKLLSEAKERFVRAAAETRQK